MLRIAFSLVLILILVPAAGAQQSAGLNGRVTSSDGTALAGATVTVRCADGPSRTAVTDTNGEYSVSGLAPGDAEITVVFQGLETERLEVTLATGENSRNAVLRAEFSDVTVVTGSHIAGAEDTGAVAVSVLEIEEIDAFGAVTTGEVFANIAQAGEMEFNETSDGPNSARGDVATINLRGLGAGNTLVLLNGRRLTAHPVSQDISSTPATIVNVNSIPSAAIERVEVLRDGASALYGTDATGGVVNTVLSGGYEGFRVSLRDSVSEGTDFEERNLDFSFGRNLGEKTNITLFGTLYERDGMLASERSYSASVDKRPLLPPDWEGDSNFRNTSSRGPWGEFQVGSLVGDLFVGQVVNQEGSGITSSSGRFHVQPSSQSGGVPFGDIELDDGSQSSSLFYDFNIPRQITPDIDRTNLYGVLTHQIRSDLEFFAELGYYDSSSFAQRAAQPIDNGLAFIIVPKENYWNPFGAVGNPNRLEGIDAPAEGLDVLIRRYRPLEHGPRVIETDHEMYRVLGGLRGTWKGWSWDSAVLHNEAESRDSEGNRLSKTLLRDRLSLSTPDAWNPFGGPDANSQATLDAVRISTNNNFETTLTSADFRASNPSLFKAPGGRAGAALGAEWRHESYVDDRDPRLDGTITFLGGGGSDGSDVVGVSPTNDSDGSRDIYSLYGETIIPLVGPGHDVPGVVSLDVQLALRAESIRDTGEDIVKPKVALSWFPAQWLLFRGAYSEGFRAPNLVQLNRGDISRLNTGQEDFWRSDVTGLPEDEGDTFRRSVRSSNPDLVSEETETVVGGMELHLPIFQRFRINVDYWTFDQENVIDNFGVEEALALDFLLRQQGSFNPNVVRAALTPEDLAAFDAWNAANPDDQRSPAGEVLFVSDPYQNLDPRSVEGIDYGISLMVATSANSTLSFNAEATQLRRFDQRRDSLAPLFEDPRFADEFSAQQVDRIGLNGKPPWRASGSLIWRNPRWTAGVSFKFIDKFFDTSATNDTTGEFWTVDSWEVWNIFGELKWRNWRLRSGVNNIADEDPPLADESRGYFSSSHNNRGRQFYMRLAYSM